MAAGYPVGIEPTSPEPQSGGLPLAYGHLIAGTGFEPVVPGYEPSVLTVTPARGAYREKRGSTLGKSQPTRLAEAGPIRTGEQAPPLGFGSVQYLPVHFHLRECPGNHLV